MSGTLSPRAKRAQPIAGPSIESSGMLRHLVIFAFVLAPTGSAVAQIQDGGARAGVGRVIDGAGRSSAAKELQQKMNGSLLRLAVAKSKVGRQKISTSKATVSRTATGRPVAVPASKPAFTDFRPAKTSDFVDRFAAALSSNPAEQQLVRQLVSATRDAFEQEVAKKGRPNNLAAAFTFFVASTVMVYHDDPEPSDETLDQLWDSLNETLNGLPEMSKLSDSEKQEMYEMLVACGGLVLAGHVYSKESGDANSSAVYRQLAGEMIKNVLNVDPNTIRFNSGGLSLAG